jgi:guanylate kinase
MSKDLADSSDPQYQIVEALKDPTAQRRGLIFILSSPSGAGKSTLSRKLLGKEASRVNLSISVTTRERRGQ